MKMRWDESLVFKIERKREREKEREKEKWRKINILQNKEGYRMSSWWFWRWWRGWKWWWMALYIIEESCNKIIIKIKIKNTLILFRICKLIFY